MHTDGLSAFQTPVLSFGLCPLPRPLIFGYIVRAWRENMTTCPSVQQLPKTWPMQGARQLRSEPHSRGDTACPAPSSPVRWPSGGRPRPPVHCHWLRRDLGDLLAGTGSAEEGRSIFEII